MNVQIFKDIEALSHAAADLFVRSATQAVEKHGRFLVALSGGGTPSGLYRLLARKPFRDQIAWDKTFVFWGDERCVPPDDEGSNFYQANEILLSQVPIPDKNILRIEGEFAPHKASDAYAQVLKEFADPDLDWPRFDLVLLGMGDDGHTASLFPGSQVETSSPTLAVTADYQGRPAERVTLTPLVLNSARMVLFLVSGESKAVTLSRVLSDKSNQNLYPAGRIQPIDGELIWFVDESAASKL